MKDTAIQELQANARARERLKVEQSVLFNAIAGLFYRHDIEGCIFTENPHDYETECETIIPRLSECASARDCQRVIHEEFTQCFAGEVWPLESYDKLGKAVWEVWRANVI